MFEPGNEDLPPNSNLDLPMLEFLVCQCSGNCGNPQCWRGPFGPKKKKSGQICGRKPLQGFRFCFECKCMVAGCKWSKRIFCGLHCARCAPSVAVKASELDSPHGGKTKLRSYSPVLFAIGKHSHTLAAARRTDYVEMLNLARKLFVPSPGEHLPWRSLMMLFLAGAIKVPQAIHHFRNTLAASAPGGLGNRPRSRNHFLDAWVSALKFCDGREWPLTWKRMNGKAGTMAYTTGIIAHSRLIGLIEAEKTIKGKKHKVIFLSHCLARSTRFLGGLY